VPPQNGEASIVFSQGITIANLHDRDIAQQVLGSGNIFSRSLARFSSPSATKVFTKLM